jgi:hypothetical protein
MMLSCAPLCEAANAARRTKTVFPARCESLVIRCGHKKTIIAFAHKLARTICFVLVRRKPYRDSTVDYEAARRQERPGLDPSLSRNTAVLARGRRSKCADHGDRKLILPARRISGFGARQ